MTGLPGYSPTNSAVHSASALGCVHRTKVLVPEGGVGAGGEGEKMW